MRFSKTRSSYSPAFFPHLYLISSVSIRFSNFYNKRDWQRRRKGTQWRMNEKAEPFSIKILSFIHGRGSVSKNLSNVYDTRLFTIRRESADILHVEEKSRRGNSDSHLAGCPCSNFIVRIGCVIYRSKWCPPFSPYRITRRAGERSSREGEDKRKLRGSKDSFLLQFDSIGWKEGLKFYAKSFALEQSWSKVEVRRRKRKIDFSQR